MRAPTEQAISISRLICTGCGVETNATCNCGVPYRAKSVRAREAVEANPEKSDRAIAAELGVSAPTVGKARKEATVNNFTVERTGLDGKTRKLPEAKQQDASLGEPEPIDPEDYVRLLTERDRLQDSVSRLTEALNAKEAEVERNWPSDMNPKQIKKRDGCLRNIAWWQRALEKLYGEVTGQPVWRLELVAEDGTRLSNGVRLATRGEAEAYAEAVSRESEGKAEVEILPCESEKANTEFIGTSIHFAHGDCVLLNWLPK